MITKPIYLTLQKRSCSSDEIKSDCPGKNCIRTKLHFSMYVNKVENKHFEEFAYLFVTYEKSNTTSNIYIYIISNEIII